MTPWILPPWVSKSHTVNPDYAPDSAPKLPDTDCQPFFPVILLPIQSTKCIYFVTGVRCKLVEF